MALTIIRKNAKPNQPEQLNPTDTTMVAAAVDGVTQEVKEEIQDSTDPKKQEVEQVFSPDNEPQAFTNGEMLDQKVTEAVIAFANQDKKTPLMIVHKKTGKTWIVVEHDLITGQTTLTDSTGMRIKPILTSREDDFYTVIWRE